MKLKKKIKEIPEDGKTLNDLWSESVDIIENKVQIIDITGTQTKINIKDNKGNITEIKKSFDSGKKEFELCDKIFKPFSGYVLRFGEKTDDETEFNKKIGADLVNNEFLKKFWQISFLGKTFEDETKIITQENISKKNYRYDMNVIRPFREPDFVDATSDSIGNNILKDLFEDGIEGFSKLLEKKK